MKINDMVIIVNDSDVGGLIVERETKNGKTLYTYEFEKDGEIHTQTSELPMNCKVLISSFTHAQTKKLFATKPRAGDIVKEEIEDATKTVGICKQCAKVNNIEESLSVGKLLPFKCACCESLVDPKEDKYFVTRESEIRIIYRQPFKKKVDVSISEDGFCGECDMLNITEEEQDSCKAGNVDHVCRKYGMRVFHGKHHPKIMKLRCCNYSC
jgi:hypothetical protein